MALFKIYRGLEANLPTEMHDGYAYFCSDSAAFFIDFLDSDGNLQRKQLNAKDAETLSGASLATILQSSEVEIPTSKAVFDALEAKQNKLTGAQGQLAGFDSNGDLIATDPKLIVDVEFDSDMTTFVSASHTYAEITDAINAGKDVYVNNVALGLLHSYIQTYDGMMYFGFFAGVTYARFAVGSDNNWLYSSENVQHKPEVFAATITDASITIDDIVSGEEFGLTTTYDYMEIMNATANDLCDVYIMVDGFSTPLKNVRIDNDPTTIASRFEGVTRITANDESVLVYATVQVRDGIYCMCIPVSNDTFAVTAELGYSYETDRGKEYIIDSLSASFDEVYSAFTDGKNVVAYAGDYIIPLTYCYSGRAVFSTISYEGNNYHCYFYLNGAKFANPAAILYCDNIVVGQVDEAPTQYSENVIKSGAVYSALEEKQNKLTFDEAPTADSTNPVTSGGVYAARSDWNQNDETAPDYVKNRTHYIISPEKTIFEWDGNIEGLESIEGTLSSYKIICYKMSDDTSWAVQEPVNATRFDKIGSEEGYLESEITPVYMDDILEYSVYTSALYVVFAESYTISKYNVTLSKGTWVLVIDEASIGGISRISKLSTIPVYQKIPNHYLPAPTINAGTGKNAEVFNGIAAENASGDYSHTEGQGTTASASCAHSEGDRTVASGNCSHAEGSGSDATGTCSHAEGQSTTASGIASHTEGICVEASGNYSHAEGYYTTANSKSQHTQGEYNVVDTENKNSRGTYSHVVGNGTSDTKRSNAHTLDWSGNAWFAGDVYVGSTSGTNKDEGSVKLMKEVTGAQGQVIGFDADGNAIAQDMPSSMPSVTTSDNGKFLRVVDGAWAATTVQSAEEVSF